MHQYLRAIGFSNLKTNNDLKGMLNSVASGYDREARIATDRGVYYVEFTKYFAGPLGITLRAEVENDNLMVLDFYYPILDSNVLTSCEEVSIERHADKESFAGLCEDPRLGISMIFTLYNGVDYMRSCALDKFSKKGNSLMVAGLSDEGKILLPIKKNEKELALCRTKGNERKENILAAREGNEEAMEKLTIEDMDIYAALSRKIKNTDIMTLVDSYIMPYGVECEKYSVLAEIDEVEMYSNSLSGEDVYVLTLNINDLRLQVGINKIDLLGEPVAGRRFKGVIWMGAMLHMPE